MDFAIRLVEQVTAVAEALAVPPVRAVHVPSREIAGKDGEFCAVELADGTLGLSYVLLDDTLDRLLEPAATGGVVGRPALEVARLYRDGQGAARTLGFAACQAITQHLWSRAGFVPPAATDSLAGIDPHPGDHVGMVGFFPPLVKQVPGTGARLTVLELRADLAGAHEGFEVVLDPQALGACNKVLSTSTVLLNDTLEAILSACRGAQVFAMIGPGAGVMPDALFERGVTVLGGATVVDGPGFVQALREGRAWGPCARKFALRAADYPGLEALLRRSLSHLKDGSQS